MVDPTQAKQGTKDVENRLDRVQNKADGLRKTLARTFGILGGTALIFQTVRSLATFEESLATLRAITGATAEEFKALREEASRLGLETRFTATQAADALVNLSRAGFSVQEGLAAAGDTLNLAVAGNLDLASASDIAASALRGFRLDVDEATRVTDVLTLTANSANTTLYQLGDAVKFVAPVAAGLGQSIEVTSAALGALSDAGLKATLAGTGLRRVLAELEAPSSTSIKLLKALGVEADQVRVSQVGLVAALEELKKANITTGESLQIFGQRGGPAFEVLVNNIPKIKQLNQELENSQGVAKRTADEIDQSLLGSLRRVLSAFEGVIIAAGDAGGVDALTSAFEGLAQALRFLATNIDVVGKTLIQLLALLVVAKVTAFAQGIFYAARSLYGLQAALLAVRTSALSAQASFGILGVALLGVNKLLQMQDDILNDIEQSYKNLETDAKFARLGHVIRNANQELKVLQRSIDAQQERGFGPSEIQLERIAQLKDRIKDATMEIKQQANEQKRIREAQEAQLPTIDNLIAKLAREAQALRDLGRESEIQRRAQEEINQLLVQGARGVGDDERKQVEDKLRIIEALKDQKKLLEDIKGPQEQFAREQAALNALQAAGQITAEEYRAKLAELKGEMEESVGVVSDPFAEQVKSLREMNEELRIRTEQQGVAEQGLLLELDLRRQGVELTNEQSRTLAGLLFAQEELNEKLRQQRTEEEAMLELAKRNERSVEQLIQQAKATEQISAQQEILNRKFQEGAIDQETYIAISEKLTLKQLQSATTIEAGWTRAFLRIKQEAEDFASVMESIVNVFSDNLTNAIVEFAETGKFSFKDFANAIIKDLIRIIVRLLVVQALSAVFGGGAAVGASAASGAAVSGALAGSRQDGGTVQPGRSFLVGENGPEIFTPDRTGSVTPNAKDQPLTRPEVKVQVVNVQDPNEIPQAINDGSSDEAIINSMARNRDRIRQVLQ